MKLFTQTPKFIYNLFRVDKGIWLWTSGEDPVIFDLPVTVLFWPDPSSKLYIQLIHLKILRIFYRNFSNFYSLYQVMVGSERGFWIHWKHFLFLFTTAINYNKQPPLRHRKIMQHIRHKSSNRTNKWSHNLTTLLPLCAGWEVKLAELLSSVSSDAASGTNWTQFPGF